MNKQANTAGAPGALSTRRLARRSGGGIDLRARCGQEPHGADETPRSGAALASVLAPSFIRPRVC